MGAVVRNGALWAVLSTLAEYIDRDSPITLLLVFGRIAAAGPTGVLQATVQRELGLPDSVLTRAVKALSGGNTAKGRSGYGLITQTLDYADTRHRVLRITDKGAELLQRAYPTP